ncbi:MAG: peptide chain release factor 1 [Thermorudis peleae]|nr:peptide chain release factor 1 [Thermorudis peleae]
MAITRTDIEALASIQPQPWPVISLYVQIAQEHVTDDHYSIRVKNLLKQLSDQPGIALSHEQDAAFREDLERIRLFFRDHGDDYGDAVALFCSSRAGIWHVYSVPRAVGNHAAVDFRPMIAPLVHALDQIEPFCVCLIARDRARIFLGNVSEFREVAVRLDQQVPGQHDQGGWAQARFQRHIDEHARQHFKTIANVLFELFNQEPFRFLVAGGTDEVVAAFVETLHPYLSERYVGHFNCELDASVKEIKEAAWGVVQDWLQRDKARNLDLLLEEALSQDMGVVGLPAVADAIQMGNVLTLVLDDRLSAPGAYCPACGAVQPLDQPPEDEHCVYCQGALRKVANIVPVLYANAYRQSASVLFLTERELQMRLEPHGGIGALLRYRLGAEG